MTDLRFEQSKMMKTIFWRTRRAELDKPQYQAHTDQRFLFEETEYIIQFDKSNYGFSISDGFMSIILHLKSCVLDTGAGPSLIAESFFKA